MATPEQVELAQELQALAQKLLATAARLMGEVPEPEPEFDFEEEEERLPRPDQDVGRFGIVNIAVARVKAAQLGEFDRGQFAQALGLKVSKAGKWLDKLRDADIVEFVDGSFRCLIAPELRDWAISADGSFKVEEAAEAVKKTVEETQAELDTLLARGIIVSVNGNGRYRYEPPKDSGVLSHPSRLPEWRERPCGELSQATGMPVRVRATERATRRQRSVAGAGGIKGAKQKDRRFEQMQQVKAARAEAKKAKAQRDPGFKSRSGKRSRPAA